MKSRGGIIQHNEMCSNQKERWREVHKKRGGKFRLKASCDGKIQFKILRDFCNKNICLQME